MKRTIIGLVPARGGSVGVPRKNLALVGSKSLLSRAVDSALSSSHVQGCVVSSDNDEILRQAVKLGANIARRPSALASASSRADVVVGHFLGHRTGSMLRPQDVIVYLQPTSPFRSHAHVDGALDLLLEENAGCVVGVKAATEHPAKLLVRRDDGLLYPGFLDADTSGNRQDLQNFYYPNGSIYAFTVESFHRAGGFPIDGSLPYLMGPRDSIDIDVADDLEIARGVAEFAGV